MNDSTQEISILKKQITDLTERIDEFSRMFKAHDHDGVNSVAVLDTDVVTDYRSGGSISLATEGTTYKLGVTNKPRSIMFYGLVTSSADNVRSLVIGSAHLGKSYYFQPDTSSTVKPGSFGNIYQSATCLTIDSDSTLSAGVKAIVSEGHLINAILTSGSDIIARATVTAFSNESVSVYLATLASGYTVDGNFVVS